MRSMLALLPYLPVTTMQGVVARRLDTLTPCSLESSTTFFHHLVRSLNCSFSSCGGEGTQPNAHVNEVLASECECKTPSRVRRGLIATANPRQVR